ncbi:MAG: RluA family pseudouridine synthase [Casimicrobiaceae bacterium]
MGIDDPRPDAILAEPTLAALVRKRTGVPWSRARRLCEEGRVTVNGERCLDPASRIAADAVVVVDAQSPRLRTGPLDASAIVFADRDIVIVDKPVGMLSVADEPGNKDTLADHLRTILRTKGSRGADARLGVVHRLDKDTSGLMVFARTAEAKRVLAARFRAHDIERVYHAIAHGAVTAKRVETLLILDRGDGIRGSYGHFRRPSGVTPPEAKRSVTHVRPIATLVGATLVECRLETGRQHQIRIHLAELGHPLIGERVYIRDHVGMRIDSSRPMLHARNLGFAHPRTAEHLSFQREPPPDFQAMLEALRPIRA